MPSNFSAILLSSSGRPLPHAVSEWLREHGMEVSVVASADDMMARCLRGRPRIALLDARQEASEAEAACARIKEDSYSAVVPTVILCARAEEQMERGFAAGAD